MGIVSFSVPDNVKEEFNKTFKGENKSAILTRLMRQAIEEHKRQNTVARRRSTHVSSLR